MTGDLCNITRFFSPLSPLHLPHLHRRAEVGLKRVVSSCNGIVDPSRESLGKLGCAAFTAFSCNSDVLVNSERTSPVTNSALI